MASLDDILDSVDLDDVNELVNKNEDSCNMDLDNLLDSVADDMMMEVDIDSDLVLGHDDSQQLRPWELSTSSLPATLSSRWTGLVKADLRSKYSHSEFQLSPAYQSWDSKYTHSSLKVLTMEKVRNACVKLQLDDSLSRSTISALTTPKGEVLDQIAASFGEYLLSELKSDIIHDINYKPDKFPNIAALLKNFSK